MKAKSRRFSTVYRIFLPAFAVLWLFAAADGFADIADIEAKTDPATKQKALFTERLMSLDPKSEQFLIRSGKGSGEKVSMSMKRSKNSPDLWTLTFGNFYKLFIHRDSLGAVQIARIEILDRQKAISFSPSIELTPPLIATERRIRTSGWTNVSSLKSGKNINEGTFTHSFKGFTRASFETPSGNVDGYLILYESRLDLNYATLRINLEAGFSKEKKLVYWRTKSLSKKLLLFGRKTIHEFIVAN